MGPGMLGENCVSDLEVKGMTLSANITPISKMFPILTNIAEASFWNPRPKDASPIYSRYGRVRLMVAQPFDP